MPPEVSILIVSWNTRPQLERCLAFLDPHRHEVIVVDNASTDGSADEAARVSPNVTVVRQARNLGFAGAVNAAAARAHGRFLMLLNPDVRAHPDSIDRLAELLDAHVDYAAIGGRLINEDGKAQVGFTVRRFPTLAAWAVDLLLVDKLWPGNAISRRYLALDLDLSKAQDVDQPAAACLMVRHEAFAAVGGLDERFFPAWYEDVDFCRRLRDAGWRVGYTPDASFAHEGGVAMRALGLGAFSRAWYRNLLRYAKKHHGPVTSLTLRALIIVGMILRATISLVTGRPRDAKAYLGVLRDVVADRSTG
ncbi:MAG: glycosyltransferase [Luteitalea sp.]|nr:glycosyltransferase [Luteitalea sp.]